MMREHVRTHDLGRETPHACCTTLHDVLCCTLDHGAQMSHVANSHVACRV